MKHLGKLSSFLLMLIFITDVNNSCFSQSVGINSTGSSPNSSAGLDIDFTDKGMLVPRVSLTSTTDVSTISSPATSLLVYNTNAAITNGTGVGYYYYSGSAWVPVLSGSVGVPTGTVSSYAASTPPAGWLLANGAAVSRSTYSALFAVIGNTYGAGDGSTTFNLPASNSTLVGVGSGLAGTSLFTDDNLVSYWKLDGNSNDSKGSNTGSDATVSYGTSYGKFNQGASFNGSSSQISLTASGLPTGSSARSISFWFKKSGAAAGDGIFGWGSTTSTGQQCMMLIPDHRFYFGGYSQDLSATTIVDDGNWHFCVFTMDNSGNAKIYTDGALENSGTISLNTTNQITRFGCRPDNSSFYASNLDDVAVFSRAISALEVTTLYNSSTVSGPTYNIIKH